MARYFIIIIFMLYILSGCSNAEPISKDIFAMNTIMTITAYTDEQTMKKAEAEIKRIELLLDRGIPESDAAKINSGQNVTKETIRLVKTANKISADTEGAFDISIAPIMDAWGFLGQQFTVPTEQEREQKMLLTDYKKIKILPDKISMDAGMQIDFGGIAKGYTSDRIIALLKENHVTSALLSLGGNVQALGKKPNGTPWKVAVQNPNNEKAYICVLDIDNKAVITSGGYQRYFEYKGKKYHHIIDPATGSPSNSGLTSITIVSDNATTADGLSTALFVMGFDKAVEFWRQYHDNYDDFGMILVTQNNVAYITSNIADKAEFDGYPYQMIN